MSEYRDYAVRATAAGGYVRAFAATTRNLTEEARRYHNTSPVVTAALGRLLTAGVMMGLMMKGDKDILTIQMKGDGPMGGLTVTADSKGRVKGYADQPAVLIPANSKGKLDVGGAIGRGYLTVIKDLGLKEPYSGRVELQTGEIGDDLTYYFAASEQVPSSVGLGVLMEKNNTVKQAGGFIVQLMPGTSEEVIETLEEKLGKITSVTDMLEKGYTPEKILEELLADLELELNDRIPAEFYCNCSRDRVAKALISLGEKELTSMIAEGKPVELVCHFCSRKYQFSVAELEEMLAAARK